MTTRMGHTPGALSAATVIFRQLERLVPKPLADREDTIEGMAAIIDEHTAAPGWWKANRDAIKAALAKARG